MTQDPIQAQDAATVIVDRDAGIRLWRCPHGTFHLTLGPVSLHLTDVELTRLGQVIRTWAQHHPSWVLEMAKHNGFAT